MTFTSPERRIIADACAEFPSDYARLVAPVNEDLDALGAAVTPEMTGQVLANLKAFAAGEVPIGECHRDEAMGFIRDGIAALHADDPANAAISFFGAGLNFASALAKTPAGPGADRRAELRAAFAAVITPLADGGARGGN
ncbi:hypothetical protein [Mycetocola spongiae]|uniref:hypothetical protein n=1 Tax=Mycetocola spongiae TaxID=2859226 RepID=UPI001CF0E4A7|nr:hypothetical protein [Mycetocola spongiae]UCR89225.1 hypothetical protein KXZ72_00475 [Mycetocola spongiae]